MNKKGNLLAALIVGVCLTATFFSFKSTGLQGSLEYRQFSTIESVVQGGMGRSRIISTDNNGSLVEKDLMNFYSLVGINFGNISNNDKLIVDKLNEYTKDGWELVSVNTGVQSPADKGGSGIFLTRYLFKRAR